MRKLRKSLANATPDRARPLLLDGAFPLAGQRQTANRRCPAYGRSQKPSPQSSALAACQAAGAPAAFAGVTCRATPATRSLGSQAPGAIRASHPGRAPCAAPICRARQAPGPSDSPHTTHAACPSQARRVLRALCYACATHFRRAGANPSIRSARQTCGASGAQTPGSSADCDSVARCELVRPRLLVRVSARGRLSGLAICPANPAEADTRRHPESRERSRAGAAQEEVGRL